MSFALQMYQEARNKEWPKWQSTSSEQELIKGMKEMIIERFDYFNWPEVALAELERYCQEEEETEKYLTWFQNLKGDSQIIVDFAKHLLLWNIKVDLVEKLLTQSGEQSYEELVKDLW